MGKKLQVGDLAPDFTATTNRGESISISQYRGDLIWLIFYRYPKCPLCNLHVSSVVHRMKTLPKKGFQIIAVFESPAAYFPEKMQDGKMPGFPLISDSKKTIYKLYQTESRLSAVFAPQVVTSFFKALSSGFKQGSIDGDLGQIPAHFLIAEDGLIEHIHYGKNIADHIPWDTVENFIKDRKGHGWKEGPSGVKSQSK